MTAPMPPDRAPLMTATEIEWAAQIAPMNDGNFLIGPRLYASLLAMACASLPRASGDGVVVPREPTPGLLMSMALRADHALGMPGYYDQPLIARKGVTHARRLELALAEARKMHEEVVGSGFYAPEREGFYFAMLPSADARDDGEG